MKAYDAPTLAALSKGGLVLRDFLYLYAKTSGGVVTPFGFWSGENTVSVNVVSAQSRQVEARTYQGTGAVLDWPQIVAQIGLDVRTLEVVLSPLHAGVADMVRGHVVKHALAELHRGLFDVQTGQIVSAPHPEFLGKVDGAPIETPAAGGEASVKVRIVSSVDELTRTSTAKKSDESQKLRASDRFRRYAGVAGTISVWWGEAKAEGGS